jgi:hypothetical protein
LILNTNTTGAQCADSASFIHSLPGRSSERLSFCWFHHIHICCLPAQPATPHPPTAPTLSSVALSSGGQADAVSTYLKHYFEVFGGTFPHSWIGLLFGGWLSVRTWRKLESVCANPG